MPDFRYQAVDRQDRMFSEIITAPSLLHATEELRTKRVDVVSIASLDGERRLYEPRDARPPMTPRDVKVKLSDSPGGLVLVLVGGFFSAIASIFILIGLTLLAGDVEAGRFFTLFPLIHLSVGLAMIAFVVRGYRRRKRLYRDGEVAMARVQGVGYNRNYRVNGRNPYELVWSFEVNGHTYHDKISSFNKHMLSYAPGEPIWVVYDPDDPEQSVAWPPVSRN